MLEKEYIPQYGDLDPDFSVGLRGYLAWFQDIATEYINNKELGNDRLPGKYGVFWVYAENHLKIYKKALRRQSLTLRVWSSQNAPEGWMWQEYTVYNGQELMAMGRLKSCLVDKNTGHRCKTPPIAIPRDLGFDLPESLAETDFSSALPSEPCFSHRVRFSDLDANRHLNNLSVVRLLLDAYSSYELDERQPEEFAVRYNAQCFEGETVEVYRVDRPESSTLTLTKENGAMAALGVVRWKDKTKIPS